MVGDAMAAVPLLELKTPPGLVQVEQHAAAGLGNDLHAAFDLSAAVASDRMEDVPRQAVGVNPDQHRFFRANGAEHQGHVGLLLDLAFEGQHPEGAELGRQVGLGHQLHE